MTGKPRLPRFNFDTMSGVYPGTRTQVFQRLLLHRAPTPASMTKVGDGDASAPSEPEASASDSPAEWALIYWYEDPAACVVRMEGADAAMPALRLVDPLGTGSGAEPEADANADPDAEPHAGPASAAGGDSAALLARLEAALAGWQRHPVVCGNCRHWQTGVGATVDGLPLGACTLQRAAGADEAGGADALPLLLSAQSILAIGCPHWQARTRVAADPDTAPDGADVVDPASVDRAPASAPALLPLPKVAELSESKMKPLRRLRLRLSRWLKPPLTAPTLTDRLVERSGVGAGTEPCPCCQGRIANLGALAVADEAGDKQTLSVWRCRVCHALYLSDWIDRWERVDNLETEETLYRIAPIEAAELLTLIAGVSEAEHPRRRDERSAERAWVLAQVAGRVPVSHIVKQGR